MICHEKIINLSNSQKQKVVIARALINNPNIIIADQPETFLDEVSKRKIFSRYFIYYYKFNNNTYSYLF